MIGILGGTGFIGLNLCRRLQIQQVPCRTFSRNGLLLNSQNVYYSHLSSIPHVTGDIRDKRAVAEFVGSSRAVVLLVSHLLPSSDAADIAAVTSWYTTAFGHLLDCGLKARIDQIVFVSSGGTIYGENPGRSPVDEEYPLNSKCAYGSFCAFLEHTLKRYNYEHGLPFTILRLGNPYGLLKRPNKDQGLIDHYIRSARARRPFTIFGDGNEVRDYTYVDDATAVIACVLRSPPQNRIFNVGTGCGHTSKEVIDLVKKQFDLPDVPILLRDRRLGDVGCSLLNMNKFEKAYGMRCNTSLEVGLQRYAALEASAGQAFDFLRPKDFL